MIWPNEKCIGIGIFAVGVVTALISVWVWFRARYRFRLPWIPKDQAAISAAPITEGSGGSKENEPGQRAARDGQNGLG